MECAKCHRYMLVKLCSSPISGVAGCWVVERTYSWMNRYRRVLTCWEKKVENWLRRDKEGQDKDKSTVDWGYVVFEVDLLKSQEINLDYILELIFEHNKKNKSKEGLIEDVRRMIRGSLGNRAKESLVVDFIHQTNLDEFNDKASIIDAFFKFAQAEQKREADAIIVSEKLNEEAAKRYMTSSLKREYASENGTALNEALPKLIPLNPQYRTQKQTVFQKIAAFVEKFKGVGGQL